MPLNASSRTEFGPIGSAFGPPRRPRLLIVDDQPANVQSLYQALAADYQVLMATGGAQALAQCAKQPPDLVLLDVAMPGIDGHEVCRRLKADVATRSIPIIFVTAHSDEAAETMGLGLGAVDFISKPINAKIVRARVKAHLMSRSRPMDRVAPAAPEYRAAFIRFMLGQDSYAREEALAAATEIGKAALGAGSAIDQLLELHHYTQAALAEQWRQPGTGDAEVAARERLARGDATLLMLALILPHELALLAHHEQRWRREHDTLAAMFEQTDDLIAILDDGGRIDAVNPAFVRATGWSAEEAVTGPMAEWPTPLPAAATQQHRCEQARKDGGSFVVEWSVSPVLGRDGELLGHVCIGRDITRQMQVEDSLRENDKLRAVATLAGGIAHDFNNLLGSIIGLAELCAIEAPAGSRQARNLDRIGQAGAKAATLVRQMLDFSRQAPRTVELMPLSALLAHAEGLLRAALPQWVGLTLTVDVDGPVRIDLVQMEQALLNLTRNAAQAMPEPGGVVRIVADRADPAGAEGDSGGWMRLRVIDTGAGIAADLLPKIFEPFFTTKPVGEGTGLGLSAVHGIVSSHDGRVEVSSAPGAGTTFSVYLPLAPAADRSGGAGPVAGGS